MTWSLRRKAQKVSVRPHLIEAKIGDITQGTVFTCIKVPRYPDISGYGLVITARCDIAQDKYPVLNYLPVVPLDSWFAVDGIRTLIANEQSSLSAKIKDCLKQAGISESLLLSIELDEIAKIHFPSNATKTVEKKRAVRIRELIEQKVFFDHFLLKKDGKVIFQWFVENRPKEVKNLVDRLSRHDVAGYYLFEELLDESADAAFVCLLRDVAALPRDIAIEISNGLSRHALDRFAECTGHENLEIQGDDLAMPISCVGSPTIEHVMQTFSSLFGRIGLDDPDPEKLERIVARCYAN